MIEVEEIKNKEFIKQPINGLLYELLELSDTNKCESAEDMQIALEKIHDKLTSIFDYKNNTV